MFFYSEPEQEFQPPQETIPNNTLSVDEGLYLISEEGSYFILE